MSRLFSAPVLNLQSTEAAANYLENRLESRKFLLGVAAAPLGASFFLLDYIRSVEGLFYDWLLTIALTGFTLTALISAIQIHRFTQAIGLIRSGQAQSDSLQPKIKFRMLPVATNIAEFLLLSFGYAIIIYFLLLQIWGGL